MDRGDQLTVGFIVRKRHHGNKISLNSNVTRLPKFPPILDQREASRWLSHHDEICVSMSLSRRRPRRSQPRNWLVALLSLLLLLWSASSCLPFVLPWVYVKTDRQQWPPRITNRPASPAPPFVSATTDKAASTQVDAPIVSPPADRNHHDDINVGGDSHIFPRERFLVHRGKSADMIYRAPGTCRTRACHRFGKCYAQACILRRSC
jgi:hypothetical protein